MSRSAELQFLRALARALAGATIFAVPLLMTMEMWWLGFYMEPLRLALFLALTLPMLVGLSYFAGFEETFDLWDEVLDALVAFAVGCVAAALLLGLFGVLTAGQSAAEIVGKIALQAVPASIGALVAREQLGIHNEDEERRKADAGYLGAMFVMACGALFVAFNVAPTEEMILIAYQMTPWHAVALALLSLAALHALVYTIGFVGQAQYGEASFLSIFLRFSTAGYALALLVSLYVLWSFGRLDGLAPHLVLMTTVVLGFPAALGAATARLII